LNTIVSPSCLFSYDILLISLRVYCSIIMDMTLDMMDVTLIISQNLEENSMINRKLS